MSREPPNSQLTTPRQLPGCPALSASSSCAQGNHCSDGNSQTLFSTRAAHMAEGKPVYTLADLKQHTTDKSCWLTINGKVYDVTEFLEEHPGGYDIILSSTGRDATRDFDEIGHSNSAKSLLEKYLIGTLEGGAPLKTETAAAPPPPAKPVSSTARMANVLLPIVLLAVAVALNIYLTKEKTKK